MKKLVRPTQGRVIAGVALGLANYFNIDVTVVRVLWALTLLPGGVPGLLLYIICWVIIPSQDKSA